MTDCCIADGWVPLTYCALAFLITVEGTVNTRRFLGRTQRNTFLWALLMNERRLARLAFILIQICTRCVFHKCLHLHNCPDASTRICLTKACALKRKFPSSHDIARKNIDKHRENDLTRESKSLDLQWRVLPCNMP